MGFEYDYLCEFVFSFFLLHCCSLLDQRLLLDWSLVLGQKMPGRVKKLIRNVLHSVLAVNFRLLFGRGEEGAEEAVTCYLAVFLWLLITFTALGNHEVDVSVLDCLLGFDDSRDACLLKQTQTNFKMFDFGFESFEKRLVQQDRVGFVDWVRILNIGTSLGRCKPA